MSISVTAIVAALPAALAARKAMGENAFREWVHQNDYVLETSFSSMKEMREAVCGAGFDVNTFFGHPKTHYRRNAAGAWFLWETRGGHIVAVMSVLDDPKEIQAFVNAVETYCGRKVFMEGSNGAVPGRRGHLSQDVPVTESLPTIFADQAILERSMQTLGISIERSEPNRVVGHSGRLLLDFRREENEAFDLKITGPENQLKAFYECLHGLTEEYGLTVQEQTYLHIRENLESSGMQLMDEEVLEDNSIVITLQIRE